MNRTLIVILIFISHSQTYAQNEWKLDESSDGIEIYIRKIPDSEFKEAKAIMEIDAEISALIAVLQDVTAYPEWVPHTKKVELLKRESETYHIHYTESETPWPLDNRDAIVSYTYSQDGVSKEILVQVENIPNYISEKKDFVRVQKSDGFWKFIPQENKTIRIIYQLYFEPGGNIPTTLYNLKVTEFPLNSLKNLRSQVKKEKYQNVEFEFVKKIIKKSQ